MLLQSAWRGEKGAGVAGYDCDGNRREMLLANDGCSARDWCYNLNACAGWRCPHTVNRNRKVAVAAV